MFDIKYSTLIQKGHFIADGHKTDPPSTLTYSSIVLHDSM